MATWIITGCSTGLGRSLAAAVLEAGHSAVLTSCWPRQCLTIDPMAAPASMVTSVTMMEGTKNEWS